MPLKLKYETIKSTPEQIQGAKFAFINKKNKEEIDATTKTKIIGFLAAIFYMLLFIYVYGSSIYGNKFLETDGSLSQAFMLCEKKGTVILMIIMLCLLQLFYSSQNINLQENDIKKIFIIIFTFIIVMTWFLLFFVWPKEATIHSFIAFITIFSTTIFALLIHDLYNSYYEPEGLIGLTATTWLSVASCVLVVVLGAIIWSMFYLKKTGPIYNKIFTVFSITEALSIFIFGIYLCVLATLPEVPNKNDLVCVIKENTN